MNLVGQGSSHAPAPNASVIAEHARPESWLGSFHSFLAGTGVSPLVLDAALSIARRDGVCLARAYLSLNIESEESLYRKLARRLGLRYVEEVPGLSVISIEGALTTGVAPIDGQSGCLSYLYAPSPEQIEELLTNARRAPPGQMFMTSCRNFTALVILHGAEKTARIASCALRCFDYELTARSIRIGDKFFSTIGILALTLLCCLPTFPSILTMIPFWFTTSIKLMAARASRNGPRRAPPLQDCNLPVYTVLAPLRREANVLPQLLEALNALDYPRSKLDVRLIVEQDDEEMLEALLNKALPNWVTVIVGPHGEPKTKPRALNIGLLGARGQLLVVYDAEDIPDPNQLRLAAAIFTAGGRRLACLQASLAINNYADSSLAFLFGLEYAALFDVLLPGLAALRLPIPLGGSSNHFRMSALRDVYAWDAWNVTEDIDLGLRLARLGYDVGIFESSTYEEAPVALTAWIAQRTRWLKGWMITLQTHFRRPRRLVQEIGLWRALSIVALIGVPISGFLAAPALLVRILWDGATGHWFDVSSFLQLTATLLAGPLFIAGIASIYWPIAQGARKRRIRSFIGYLPLVPCYIGLMTIASWLAMIELWFAPYHWAKTEHGVKEPLERVQ